MKRSRARRARAASPSGPRARAGAPARRARGGRPAAWSASARRRARAARWRAPGRPGARRRWRRRRARAARRGRRSTRCAPPPRASARARPSRRGRHVPDERVAHGPDARIELEGALERAARRVEAAEATLEDLARARRAATPPGASRSRRRRPSGRGARPARPSRSGRCWLGAREELGLEPLERRGVFGAWTSACPQVARTSLLRSPMASSRRAFSAKSSTLWASPVAASSSCSRCSSIAASAARAVLLRRSIACAAEDVGIDLEGGLGVHRGAAVVAQDGLARDGQLDVRARQAHRSSRHSSVEPGR